LRGFLFARLPPGKPICTHLVPSWGRVLTRIFHTFRRAFGLSHFLARHVRLALRRRVYDTPRIAERNMGWLDSARLTPLATR